MKSKMKRLHELSEKNLMKWQVARQDAGTEKYGNDHLKRYGLVDVMEELLDAKNILMKLHDRLLKEDEVDNIDDIHLALQFINQDITIVQEIDEKLSDRVCTDEKGGERIWWPGEQKQEGDV